MPPDIRLLRLIGRCEAISFLLLLGIAMPLKYGAGRPEFVKWTGSAHGLLFVAYCALIAFSWHRHRWPLTRPALLAIASLVPLGPFWVEKSLLQWAQGRAQ